MHSDLSELTHTGSGRNEVTADHILFHALEVIHLTADSGFVEHLRSLLEGGSGHERLRTQCSARDTLQDLLGCCALCITSLNEFLIATTERRVLIVQTTCGNNLTFAEHFAISGIRNHLTTPDTIVLLQEVQFIHYIALQETGVSRLDDLYFLHHLTYDDLEVLIVDFHTLHTVNRLCLIDDIVLNGRLTLDSQDVFRRDSTVRQSYTGANEVSFLHQNLLGQRNEVSLLLAETTGNEELTVTTFDLTERYLTVDFCHDSRVRRVTSLEELGDTRKTGGDITATIRSTRHGEQGVSYLHCRAVRIHQAGLNRQVVRTQDITVLIHDMRLRHLGLILGLRDGYLFLTCLLIGLGLAGDTFNHILITDDTV